MKTTGKTYRNQWTGLSAEERAEKARKMVAARKRNKRARQDFAAMLTQLDLAPAERTLTTTELPMLDTPQSYPDTRRSSADDLDVLAQLIVAVYRAIK